MVVLRQDFFSPHEVTVDTVNMPLRSSDLTSVYPEAMG